MDAAPAPPTARRCLYLSRFPERRSWFAAVHAGLPGQLYLQDSAGAACAMLLCGQIDLLVLDVTQCDPVIDLEAFGSLVAQQGRATVLVLCPPADARWLPALMAYGPLVYAMGPHQAPALRAQLARTLAQPRADSTLDADADGLFALLALYSDAQRALAEMADARRFGQFLCAALASWPDVMHAALYLDQGAGLRLLAGHGACSHVADALPRRCPALLAARPGEWVVFEAPAGIHDGAAAACLAESGSAMAVSFALSANGRPLGCICLLLGRVRPLSLAAFRTLDDVAGLAVLGLQMAAAAEDAGALVGRLMHHGVTRRKSGSGARP